MHVMLALIHGVIESLLQCERSLIGVNDFWCEHHTPF
jgi:hypothetical protein